MRLLAFVVLAQFVEVVSDCGGAGAPPVSDSPATVVAGGSQFACAVKQGAVRCWGANEHGQLGRGAVSASEASGAVSLPEAVAQLGVGEDVVCARTVTGRVFCWGNNDRQQLGRVDPAQSATPLEVEVPVPVAKLVMHSDYALALGSDGRLFAWGNDAEGTFARSDENTHVWPLPKPRLRAAMEHRFKDVTAGQGHACGIELDDSLWCWGRNTGHELGVTTVQDQTRTAVKVMDGVSAVVAGAFGTCAIASGEVRCFGDTPIDDVTMEHITQPTPTKMDLGGKSARQLDEQWFHVCAVASDDSLWCWGRGIEGQLGTGGMSASAIPRQVATGVRSVGTGYMFTCVVNANESVACTGENDLGQLGLGDRNRRYSLTPQ
ncbi:MAG: hypothetical protein U0228_37175 [Myxococcaceae bacterium]